MAGRIHDQEIWETAEFKAAQVAGRAKLAETLEKARQDYFGFLTQRENENLKHVISMIVRRVS